MARSSDPARDAGVKHPQLSRIQLAMPKPAGSGPRETARKIRLGGPFPRDMLRSGLTPPSTRPAIAARQSLLISKLSQRGTRRSSALTRQRYVSRVTRAGDRGRSEGFALDAHKSAQFRRLAALSDSKFARDRPDIVPRSAVRAVASAGAQLRLVGACDLDPAGHQKYDVANMLYHSDHSLTDEATEPCLGECPELRKEQPLPRRCGVSPRGHERRAIVFRGLHDTVNHEAMNHEAINHEAVTHEVLGTEGPRHPEVPVTIDRKAHSSKRSALCHSLPRHPPLPTRRALDGPYGPLRCPLRLAPGRRPKREN